MFFLLIASVRITFCAYGMRVQGAIIPKPIIANGTAGFIDGIKNAFSKKIITPDVFKKLVNNREYVEAYQVLANFSEYVDQTESVGFVARNIVRILRSISGDVFVQRIVENYPNCLALLTVLESGVEFTT